MNRVQNVFLVGAKSLGAYGGYETFIDKLSEYHEDDDEIKYHIAVKADGQGAMKVEETPGAEIISEKEFIYHKARCVRIKVPKLGPASAIIYDILALKEFCAYIEENKIEDAVVYIMACRIGPFIGPYYRRLKKAGARLYLNPDGHEWLRAKWPWIVKKYWKWSEKLMVKNADLVVCDSLNIEKYIHGEYDGKGLGGRDPKTTFIAYGSETRASVLKDDDPKLTAWYEGHGLRKNGYYLVVGRFVPENNYETMIKEFMASHSDKDFALITNSDDKFLAKLEDRLHFRRDPRIKFVGTVYDKELLMKIRENAYGYFHGHEVGGTNPSLLEALGSTRLNLLLDVGFNREVAEEAALYWTKYEGSLKALIDQADNLEAEEIDALGKKAKARIVENYSWPFIAGRYKEIFLKKE